MAVTQIADVIVNPSEFTSYILEHSLISTALFQSGVLVENGLMAAQLANGSNNFTIPVWVDPANGTEADITSDDPTVFSTPLKVTATKQVVKKSYLHKSWQEMSLASELAGADALRLVQSRVLAYWDLQHERRLIASLLGVLYSNVADNAGDMVNDISGAAGTAANFNGNSVIDTALTLGDRLNFVKSIAMASKIYGEALKNNEITFFKPSDNSLDIPTYKGMAVIIDDNLVSATAGIYITILMGPAAIGFAVAPPEFGFGTELFRIPSAGNGGGQTTLHSRENLALHPLGYTFTSASVAGESPTIGELSNGANWNRAVTQRKSVPLAFLISK